MEKIIELCVKLNMTSDLNLSADCSTEEMDSNIDRLYDYILEIKDALIKDGLHILGEIPNGERMDEMIYSLVRYPNGNVPSLREAIGRVHGYEVEDLLKDPSGILPDGTLNGEMIDIIDSEMFDLIRCSHQNDFDIAKTMDIAHDRFSGGFPDLDEAVEELAKTPGRKFVIANYTAVQPTRSALKRYISKHGGKSNE